MPTQNIQNVLSTTWTDLTTTLSLTIGTEYIIQNAGGVDMYLVESATPPNTTDLGHPISPKVSWSATPASGSSFYVRAISGATSVVVTEA